MLSKVPKNSGSQWLAFSAVLSMLASILHLAVIAGGADWYRFFGAGERMAEMAERGHWYPPLLTTAIAGVLFLWGVLALSAAGTIVRLPLLRTALIIVTAIYLARGLLIVPVFLFVPYAEGGFYYWSSFIVLGYGFVHAAGLCLAWSALAAASVGAVPQ